MNIKKTIKKKEAINLKEYVNISTGELLDSELKSNVSMTLNKDTNQFTISSDEYVTFDADAIYYLAEHLNATDRGKVMLLANMVKGHLTHQQFIDFCNQITEYQQKKNT